MTVLKSCLSITGSIKNKQQHILIHKLVWFSTATHFSNLRHIFVELFTQPFHSISIDYPLSKHKPNMEIPEK